MISGFMKNLNQRLQNKALWLTLIALLGMAIPALAQDAGTGTISGTVSDQKHSLVAGATVTITSTDNGARRVVESSTAGSFTAAFLKPGHYELTVTAQGFAKVERKNLTLMVGQVASIDLELPVASATDTVVITADAPLLDTEKVGTSQEIGQQMLSNLPINGRRFDQVVLLTPNVAPDGNSGLISYRGVSGLYNSNLIDGASNNQAFFSEARGRAIGAPYVYSTDAVQEFQTATSSYGAEFGQAAGGQINAVTKSGTNQIHGDLFYYLRYPALNALDPFTKLSSGFSQNAAIKDQLLTQLVHQQHQFGGSVGGPIIPNKLFYFLTYDGFRKVTPILYMPNYDLTKFTCPAQLTADQCSSAIAYLDGSATGMFGMKNEGTFPRQIKQDIFFPKFDWQLNDANHISAEFNWQNFNEPNGYNGSSAVAGGGATQNGTANFHERFGILNWTDAINATTVNQFTFQGSRDLETATSNTGGPAVAITGIESYGETSALPRGAFPDEYRYQFVDVLSKTLGKNDLKVGTDISLIHDHIQNLFQGDGSYTYNSNMSGLTDSTAGNLTDWMLDVYQVATATNPGQHYTQFTQVVDPITKTGIDDFWGENMSFFVQDRYKISPKLQVSGGVRYDTQIIGAPPKPNTTSDLAKLYTSTMHTNKMAFQPRVGFSYQAWKTGVIRGGYGIFVGLTSNSTFYTVRAENGVYQQQFTSKMVSSNGVYSPNQSWAPSNMEVLVTPPGPALTAPFTCTATTAGGGCGNGVVTPTAMMSDISSLTAPKLSFRGLDPNYTNPVSHSFDINLEQALPYHSSITLSYVGNRATHLPYFIDRNIDPSVKTTKTYSVVDATGAVTMTVSTPYYTSRVQTAHNSVLVGFSGLNSWYNSFAASLKKPFSNGFELLANFTYANARDNGQVSGVNGTFNGTDTPLDPYNVKGEYATSDLNMKARFTAVAVYSPKIESTIAPVKMAVNGWSLSGSFTAQSGNPVTARMSNAPSSDSLDGGLTNASVNLNNSSENGRVPQFARNAFAGPGVHNLDMRLSREFAVYKGTKLQFMAEAFNVANHANTLSVYTSYSTFVAAGKTYGPKTAPLTCPASATDGCLVPYSVASSTSPQFMSPASTNSMIFGPRQAQFSAKFLF